MTNTLTVGLARFAGTAFVAAGLALGGSLAMADVAVADTRSSSDRESHRKTAHDRQSQVGLNGNRPHRPVTTLPDQFKHLPFNPAWPGGD